MATTERNHAYENGSGWMRTIAQMVSALECDYDRLEALTGVELDSEEVGEREGLIAEATVDGDVMENADQARERIMESPLSVQVRSGWVAPGSDMSAEEFEILLSTGGPALRIVGELDEYKQPSDARLEYQDWGTPWTEYHGENYDRDALLTFCQQFYFGE